MIPDLKSRLEYWNNPRARAPRDEHDLTDSLPYPFNGYDNLFRDRSVLEIGPGRGRQYEVVSRWARINAICDIAPAALSEPVFNGAAAKYLLADYEDNFGESFEVVHFWYVLHHVRSRELERFFAFVARHTVSAGRVLFNSPVEGHPAGWYREDGIGTSPHSLDAVVDAAYRAGVVMTTIRRLNERSTGYLFIGKKL